MPPQNKGKTRDKVAQATGMSAHAREGGGDVGGEASDAADRVVHGPDPLGPRRRAQSGPALAGKKGGSSKDPPKDAPALFDLGIDTETVRRGITRAGESPGGC